MWQVWLVEHFANSEKDKIILCNIGVAEGFFMNNKYIKSLGDENNIDFLGTEGRITAREEIGHDEWQSVLKNWKTISDSRRSKII